MREWGAWNEMGREDKITGTEQGILGYDNRNVTELGWKVRSQEKKSKN